jgi:hypothetical protein
MSNILRESEGPRVLLPSSDRSTFLRGLGAMGTLATLAACSSGSAGLPNLGSSSSSLGQTRRWSSASQLAANTDTSLSFPAPSGGTITAALESNVLTVTGYNSAGVALGSFTATADTSGTGNVTWAGTGFGTPFVATPLVTPSGPVTILNHTISAASSTQASVNGSIITNGTATGSTTAGTDGTTVTTAVSGNGVATQTYSHFFSGTSSTGGGGCGDKGCPLVGIGSISPLATTGETNWFFWGLGAVAAVIGVAAIFVTLAPIILIIGALCGLVSLFWGLCVMLQ